MRMEQGNYTRYLQTGINVPHAVPCQQRTCLQMRRINHTMAEVSIQLRSSTAMSSTRPFQILQQGPKATALHAARKSSANTAKEKRQSVRTSATAQPSPGPHQHQTNMLHACSVVNITCTHTTAAIAAEDTCSCMCMLCHILRTRDDSADTS